MKFFRSHISGTILSALIMAGLLMQFSTSVRQDIRAEKFTNWLESLAIDAKSELVQSTVEELRKNPISFDDTVRRASEVIAAQTGVFQLPINMDHADHDNIRLVLLEQWSLHNQAGGMGKAATLEQTRYHVLSDKNFKIHFGSALQSSVIHLIAQTGLEPVNSATISFIRPLKNGIAINAP